MNKIKYTERAGIYADALTTFGPTTQLVVALEELSEVQKEICKALRGDPRRLHLAEEVADATIVLEQVRQIFGVNAEVCEAMDAKVLRLQQRVADEAAKKKARRVLLEKMFNTKDDTKPEETEANGEVRSGTPTA